MTPCLAHFDSRADMGALAPVAYMYRPMGIDRCRGRGLCRRLRLRAHRAARRAPESDLELQTGTVVHLAVTNLAGRRARDAMAPKMRDGTRARLGRPPQSWDEADRDRRAAGTRARSAAYLRSSWRLHVRGTPESRAAGTGAGARDVTARLRSRKRLKVY